MYLNPSEKYWACDIEGDPIPSTRVWCLCAVNVKTGDEVSITDGDAIHAWFKDRKAEGCKFIFHNGLGYDAPTLNRILKTGLTITDLIDTLVLSQVYSPSIEGGHSLSAWGDRLKFPKGDYNDFSKLTQGMVDYCLQDARLCRRVYLVLCQRLSKLGTPSTAIELEHRAWQVLKTQKDNGFAFNNKEAHILYAKLREIEQQLTEQIHELWPPKLECVKHFKQARKKDGSYTKGYQDHLEQYERLDETDDGGYDAYAYVSFHVGSPPQRVEKLLELGWEPQEFTPTGNPKPTSKGKLSPSLVAFVEQSGQPGPRLIAQWIEINARGNMINTWIEAYNGQSGCIHGSLWLANTHRYKHSGPNTANIPGVRLDKEEHPLYGLDGSFTFEARDLWISRDSSKRTMVGVDAKGIQLRVLANYLNNPEFTKNILSKDPHSANQAAFKLPSRALTKTITYATLMGAGDARIANEARVPLAEARATKKLFMENIPELPRLINKLKAQVKKEGRITLCDGSKIIIKSDHTVIPFLLQGDESKIMKRAMTTINKDCRKEKIDALQVGMIHDELQFDVLKDHVDRFIEICLAAFVEAGKYFNYNLPIEGDAKVGSSWAKTH